jgi:hypothetical protein
VQNIRQRGRFTVFGHMLKTLFDLNNSMRRLALKAPIESRFDVHDLVFTSGQVVY